MGVLNKTKARFQNRIGAPVLQSFFDFIKLARKQETLSDTATWLFRVSSALNISYVLIVATILPWMCFKPPASGADLFLVVYLLAFSRLLTILAALDTGSSFGAFAASREATLAILVEPAVVLSLVSLGLIAKTSDLNVVFSFANSQLSAQPAVWLFAGTGILFSSLVELSRMPVDDPTTHLELTMVHEAMIIESSGKNLALVELAHAVRMTIFFGFTVQCYMRIFPAVWHLSTLSQAIINISGIIALAVILGIFESLSVKLQWRKVPEFIAYCLSMSLFASLIAIGAGLIQ